MAVGHDYCPAAVAAAAHLPMHSYTREHSHVLEDRHQATCSSPVIINFADVVQ
jgi:hypothetical protein